MILEEWRVIKYWEDYAVSNFGKVRRVVQANNNHKLKPELKHSIDDGYHRVQLSKNGRRKMHSVHSLVMTAFGPPAPSIFHERDHKDRNKDNNKMSNLHWVTPEENANNRDNNAIILKGWETRRGKNLYA